MFSLVSGEILVVFVKRRTAGDKCPVHDSENLQLPIQMQLSEKRLNILITFCCISGIYMKF